MIYIKSKTTKLTFDRKSTGLPIPVYLNPIIFIAVALGFILVSTVLLLISATLFLLAPLAWLRVMKVEPLNE